MITLGKGYLHPALLEVVRQLESEALLHLAVLAPVLAVLSSRTRCACSRIGFVDDLVRSAIFRPRDKQHDTFVTLVPLLDFDW